jgi:Mg-chelatase subunit ChlD
VPVDVVLRPRRDDVGILAVEVPDRIQPGADFFVELSVGRTAGPAADPISFSVSLLRDGARVGQPRTLRLERRQTRRVRIRDRVDEERLVRYRALLDAPVGDPANDMREAVARIGDRPLVLAVGAPVPAAAGFRVEALGPAEAEAYLADPAVRARVDAILVRGSLPERAQARVAAAVRTGAGLVALGGTGYQGGPLEPLLPLTETPPEGRAALLLLDFSGSMQERKAELLGAVERLKDHFAPTDRVAFVAFRDVPVQRAPWTPAADARWDLRGLRPHGNTLLGPALRDAERMLGEVRGARRRLLVVSDGEWKDPELPSLRRRIEALEGAGIHAAALFVQDDVDPAARALFPVSVDAGTKDLGEGLLRLEDGADDRTVKEAHAAAGDVPAWLKGAVPPAGSYGGFPRLYPRDAGEKVALRDGPVPLVGAWRKVGKVVVAAPADERVDAAALLRACLRETRGIRLTARREGVGLVVEARGAAGAPFRIDGVEVPARPAGPDRWRARVARVGAGAVQVACGDAVLLVPPAVARELAGLTNRPDIARDIARRSGGRIYVHEEAAPRAPAPAVYVTLLAAALLVLGSAWWRRRT